MCVHGADFVTAMHGGGRLRMAHIALLATYVLGSILYDPVPNSGKGPTGQGNCA